MYLVRRNRNVDFPTFVDRFLAEPWSANNWMSHFEEEDSVRWSPRIDVKESKESYQVLADLPGLKKEEINISLHDNVLTLKGERKVDNEKKEKDSYRSERLHGHFSRSFALPDKVKAEEIKANYKNGVLEITLPKVEEVKPVEIEIR